MGTTIQVSEGAASALAGEIKMVLGNYPSFTLRSITGLNPVPASTTHDGLTRGIGNALSAWSDLIVSDTQAIMDADAEFQLLDQAQVVSLLGTGEVVR